MKMVNFICARCIARPKVKLDLFHRDTKELPRLRDISHHASARRAGMETTLSLLEVLVKNLLQKLEI